MKTYFHFLSIFSVLISSSFSHSQGHEGYDIYERENIRTVIEYKYGQQWDFCDCIVKNDSVNKLVETANEDQLSEILDYIDVIENHCKHVLTVPSNTPEERLAFKRKVNKCLREHEQVLERRKDQDYADFVKGYRLTTFKKYELTFRGLKSFQNYKDRIEKESDSIIAKIDSTSHIECVKPDEKKKLFNPSKGLKIVYFLDWSGNDRNSVEWIGFRVLEYSNENQAKSALSYFSFLEIVEYCLYDYFSTREYGFRDGNKVYLFSLAGMIWNHGILHQFLNDFQKEFSNNEYSIWFSGGPSETRLRPDQIDDVKIEIIEEK